MVPGGSSKGVNGPGDVTAYLIKDSRITVDSAFGKTLLLGRPWGALAQTVLVNT